MNGITVGMRVVTVKNGQRQAGSGYVAQIVAEAVNSPVAVIEWVESDRQLYGLPERSSYYVKALVAF